MIQKLVMAVALSLIVISCATIAPQFSSIRCIPGVTTRADMTRSLGTPTTIENAIDSAGKSVIEEYVLENDKQRPPEVFRGAWKIARRGVYLEYDGDTLRASLTNNSTDRLPTAFPAGLRADLKLRRSGQSDALRLFGEPTGRAILPTRLFRATSLIHLDHVAPEKAVEAWYYYYDYFYFKPRLLERFHYFRFLTLYFDGAGNLIDKFYAESDPQEPPLTRIFVQ
jgi:hypothetical protein